VTFGEYWIDNELEYWNEEQDQYGVEGLHLVRLDGQGTDLTIHGSGL